MSQLTTPLTKETGHRPVSGRRAPKAIIQFLLPSVCARLSNRRPILLRVVIIAVVPAGFVTVPYVWGLSLVDFAELVGMVVVLCEFTRFILRLAARYQAVGDAEATSDVVQQAHMVKQTDTG